MTKAIDNLQIRATEILKRPYTRRITPDQGGGYVASILEFPGCIAEGETPDEAIRNLDKAALSWVKVALANNYEFRDPVSFDGNSGKIALRIPRGLHKQVAELAELEDTSINQLLVTAIAAYVGAKSGYEATSTSLLAEVRKAVREGLAQFYHNTPLFIRIDLTEKPHFLHGLTTAPHPSLATRETITLPN